MSEDKLASEKKSSGILTKIVATVFASIMAPIVVALVVKYLSAVDKPVPPSPHVVVIEHNKDKPSSKKEKDEDNGKKEALDFLAKESLHFNGKDLSGFNVYLSGRQRDEDPKGVFTVKDGVLRISGEEAGSLITQKVYAKYLVHAEYRWGVKTWGDHQNRARTSGIAVHADRRGLFEPSIAPDVALKGSFLCQLVEGKTGDIRLIPDDLVPVRLTADIDPKRTDAGPRFFYYQPNGTKTTISTAVGITTPTSVLCGLNHDPAWRNVKGFRGKNDIEKPAGEWNTLDISCGLNNIVVRLNGKTVNVATALSRKRGKIVVRSAQAEIFFRKIDVILRDK